MDEEVFIKQLAERIKQLRVEKSMTQLDVASKMGIDDSSYRKIESGRTNPTARTIYKLAIALDVSVFQLFPEKEG
jgi:transcriptional regulator with XRE-family HTH domain